MTLLHPPYTLWHLSYVALGAALAPSLKWGLLGWTVLAFLLAMGIGAHALDELNGRPLRTQIPAASLIVLAALSIAGACAIGIWVAGHSTWWLLAFIVFGAAIVVAYNLELVGGRFHSDVWFAAAWGAFPCLTGYFASAERIRGDALALAAFAFVTSLAQRVLSTQVRSARRNRQPPGDAQPLEPGPAEAALKLLSVALPLLAGALLLARA